MNVEILETIVTPDANGTLVQLQISDKPLLAEDAAIRLVLTVRVPALELPLLVHLQREAMKVGSDALRAVLQDLASQIQQTPHDVNPRPVRR